MFLHPHSTLNRLTVQLYIYSVSKGISIAHYDEVVTRRGSESVTDGFKNAVTKHTYVIKGLTY